MNIDEISGEALQLKPHDRAMLAEIIWESLEDPFQHTNEMSDNEAIELSKKRDQEVEEKQVTPISHHDLMAHLRNEN